MKATIYHNPRCSKSRQALELLQATPGMDVEVVEYLKTPPSREKLAALYKKGGIAVADAYRKGEDVAKALNLSGADEATLLDAMAANPILIERPLVETEKGVRIGRPPESIREIL